MTTMLESFDALLEAARHEPEPQRLLLVFVRTVLPDDATEAQQQGFQSGQGGALEPIMYVDKSPNELTDFTSLVEESRQMSAAWDMLLVGCMSGLGGYEPTPEEAEAQLKNIVNTIYTGNSLAHLAAFDRQGGPMQFQ